MLSSSIGALGIVAVKNLAEEGFDVTGFDQNPFVGGLWHYADDDRVSVLPSKKSSRLRQLTLESQATDHHFTGTVINISKERVRIGSNPRAHQDLEQ
jgi:cation diffusion facilitator CzcD-associated flavoprotein CzcO